MARMAKSPRILITVPNLKRPGGVSALYNIVRLDNEPNIDYFEVHGDTKNGKISRVLELVNLYLRFCRKITAYNIVHVNPSLSSKSFIRDAIFALLASAFGKKVVVYWHGWDDRFEDKIKATSWLRILHKMSYRKANLSLVLGSVFKSKLASLGVSNQIFVESNAASDEFIAADPVTPRHIEDEGLVNCLFLARVETEKGIYIAIDAVSKLSATNNIKLTIGGDGSALEAVKAYVREKNIGNVVFTGYIDGLQKHQALKEATLFLFPTYHKEGMPISVIEAMLYGLPVLTTKVGGIPDWVENRQNGFLLDSWSADDFANAIKELL